MMDPAAEFKNNQIKVSINPFNLPSNNNINEDQPLLQNSSNTNNSNKQLQSYGIDQHSNEISPQSSNHTKSNDLSLQRLKQSNARRSASSLSRSGRQYRTNKVSEFLDNYFKITERGSSISTEIRGGTVGFLTLAYIVLLNPQVLAVSGIPYEYAASSTCLASCIATLICGVFGNIPVGCGPGVGLSAYFSYGMMPQIMDEKVVDNPYLYGLFMAFLSGFIVFVLAVPGIVTWIVNALPHFIKVATIVGMGLFLAFVGMVDVKLITAATGEGDAILQLGDMTNWIIILSLFNCLLIGTLKYFKINGSLLICIALTSIIYFGISEDWPTKIVDFPKFMNPLSVLNLNIIKSLPIQTAFESIISFVLILFLDVSGVTFAIAKLCGLSDNRDTLKEFQKPAFIGASIGSMVAAVLGCSPIIVCIETSSGAAAGARTGLCAVVMAFYFLLAMFLGPVIGKVPAAATSPVLIFIGTLMMGQVGQIAWDNMRIAIPAFLTIAMMPFTYSISNGLFFGVFSFFLIWLSTLQFLPKWEWFQKRYLMKRGVEYTFDERYRYSNADPKRKWSSEVDLSDRIHEYVQPDQSDNKL